MPRFMAVTTNYQEYYYFCPIRTDLGEDYFPNWWESPSGQTYCVGSYCWGSVWK